MCVCVWRLDQRLCSTDERWEGVRPALSHTHTHERGSCPPQTDRLRWSSPRAPVSMETLRHGRLTEMLKRSVPLCSFSLFFLNVPCLIAFIYLWKRLIQTQVNNKNSPGFTTARTCCLWGSFGPRSRAEAARWAWPPRLRPPPPLLQVGTRAGFKRLGASGPAVTSG